MSDCKISPAMELKDKPHVSLKIKIAFQYDAYRPLQWPSPWGGGGGVSVHGVSASAGVYQGPNTPVNRITDRCKNITLPQLLSGRY